MGSRVLNYRKNCYDTFGKNTWERILTKNTSSSSSLNKETKVAASPLFDKDSKSSCEIKGLLRKIQHVCIYAANIVLKESS